jgi:hypothetical protein
MKTNLIKNGLLAILGMLVMGFTSATEPVVRISGDKKIVIKLASVSENAELTIKDLSGFTFYSEFIEKSDVPFTKRFDLSTLPDGNYEVVIDMPLKAISFQFPIVSDRIPMDWVAGVETYKPVFLAKDNKVYVSKYNPEFAPLDITILDNENHVLLTETLKGESDLLRVYDFSKTKGEFTIAMESNNEIYTQLLSIK